MRRAFLSLVLLTLPFVLPTTVSAHTLQQVLGTSTVSAVLSIPPTTEGPGFLLPDSPFYFLDNIKQQIRLFFAFTPDDKAQTYMSIAGERMAELRFELQKGNLDAAEVALEGVKDNTKAAADVVAKAKFSGENTTQIAQTMNETMKRRQQVLDVLDMQATGGFKTEVTAADASVTDAKMKIEDSLPQTLLEREVQYDINRDIALNLLQTRDVASELTTELSLLQKEASTGANIQASKSGKMQQGESIGLKDMAETKLRDKLQSEVQEIMAQAQAAADAFSTLQNTSATPRPIEK